MNLIIIRYITSITLLFISGISKAICDTSAINGKADKLSKLDIFWWRKSISSNNKYKNRDKAQGEAFLGSTTIFVIFTDAWHLFDFVRDLSLAIAMIFIPDWWWVFVVFLIKQTIFEGLFRYLRKV